MDKFDFMNEALLEAEKAYKSDEIPIGAIIVYNGEIISRAHNLNRQLKNPVKHAEIIAIEQAADIMNNERLIDCDLFVTKEPCAMCSGAIIHSRIRKVYIGAADKKYGACGTVFSVSGNPKMNHKPEIEFGVLEEESSLFLKKFFKSKR
jgi:tRNA(adenine34) deaminase